MKILLLFLLLTSEIYANVKYYSPIDSETSEYSLYLYDTYLSDKSDGLYKPEMSRENPALFSGVPQGALTISLPEGNPQSASEEVNLIKDQKDTILSLISDHERDFIRDLEKKIQGHKVYPYTTFFLCAKGKSKESTNQIYGQITSAAVDENSFSKSGSQLDLDSYNENIQLFCGDYFQININIDIFSQIVFFSNQHLLNEEEKEKIFEGLQNGNIKEFQNAKNKIINQL